MRCPSCGSSNTSGWGYNYTCRSCGADFEDKREKERIEEEKRRQDERDRKGRGW